MLTKQNQLGFTVIEILVGIGIFGIVMPSIILSVVGVGRLVDRSADISRANIVAEKKVETLRSKGYNSLAIGSTTDFTSELDASFTKPRAASYTISSPYAGVKKIDVLIKYTDQGKERSLVYKTIISELGVAQ